MSHLLQPRTLKVNKPFAHALLFAVLVLPALFGTLELVLRSDGMRSYLANMTPSLGGRHLQMEEQLARLEAFAARQGHVDCIFLGSSLVWLGFDPEVFDATYADVTGLDIQCFNLGIETLPANAASLVAEVVVKRYHPGLLIYGTSARDYAIGADAEDSRVVLDTPWLQYEIGNRTPWNTFVSNSHVFRYLGRLGALLRFDEDAWSELRMGNSVSRGFLAKNTPAEESHFEAAARDAKRWLQPYAVNAVNLEALRSITRQRQNGTQVVVVEMPVSSDYYAYMGEDKKDYNRFVAHVSQALSAENMVLLRSTTEQLIPDEGWWDRSHMNKSGADIFSLWLARKIADMNDSDEVNRAILKSRTSM